MREKRRARASELRAANLQYLEGTTIALIFLLYTNKHHFRLFLNLPEHRFFDPPRILVSTHAHVNPAQRRTRDSETGQEKKILQLFFLLFRRRNSRTRFWWTTPHGPATGDKLRVMFLFRNAESAPPSELRQLLTVFFFVVSLSLGEKIPHNQRERERTAHNLGSENSRAIRNLTRESLGERQCCQFGPDRMGKAKPPSFFFEV